MTRSRLYLFDTTLRDGAQTQGVDFSLEDKRRVAATLDELGLDYIEGGYPGANRTDTEFFAAPRPLCARQIRGLRHDQARRPLGRQRSRPPGRAAGQGRRHLPRRQGLGFSRPRRAGLHQRGKRRKRRAVREGHRRQQARGHDRLRALFRRLQGQPGLCARGRRNRVQGRRPLGRAVRHQRRHAAPRNHRDRDRGHQEDPRRPAGHPHPQRHRQRRRQHAGRHPRRLPPGAGRAQRAWANAAAMPTSPRSSRRCF